MWPGETRPLNGSSEEGCQRRVLSEKSVVGKRGLPEKSHPLDRLPELKTLQKLNPNLPWLALIPYEKKNNTLIFID